MKPQVLIVGAGPTGLVLALGLEKQGIPFRIIDQNKGPGEASRAIAVHARTLEFYRQFGFAEAIIRRGIPVSHLSIHRDREKKAQLNLREIGKGLSPYPYVLSLPQDEHEKELLTQLAAKGISVEWNTRLVLFEDAGSHVRTVTVREGAEAYEQNFAYICGCDGAHSTVRKGAGFGFPGGTYEQLFYVADVRAEAPVEGLHVSFTEGGFCLYLPVRDSKSVRLIGLVPRELASRQSPAEFADLIPFIKASTGIAADGLNWFSTYRVHCRVSEHFRKGRVFIAGDAGHLHSPAGGQGMNTGIGDAVNLAWKLAAVIQGRAAEEILETYETERIAFARILVKTTDRLFQGVVRQGRPGKLVRQVLFPYVIPVLFSLYPVRRLLYKRVSQIRIQYRDSLLSIGKAGDIHGGDRLPWVPYKNGDNFKPLETVGWQLHVYGKVKPELRAFAETVPLPLCEFSWSRSAKKAGLRSGACYLVRPDGYVALADPGQDPETVRTYLNAFGILAAADKP